jgi:starch phosphorylase
LNQTPIIAKNINHPKELQQAIEKHLCFSLARSITNATPMDIYLSLALTVRDQLMPRWIQTQAMYEHETQRCLCYVSSEYLPSTHLCNALFSLNLEATARTTLATLGMDLDVIANQEPEPALGSSELSRLAACDLDALVTLGIPTISYGVRYEFGLFEQRICNNRQVEIARNWLRNGNPWEILRSEYTYIIGFGGNTEYYLDENENKRIRWLPDRFIKGSAYDTPIPGYNANTVNTLRLWKAELYEVFGERTFNLGEYRRLIEQKVASEIISKILFLDDEPAQNSGIRLEQHYFLVACTVQDILRIYLQTHRDLTQLPNKFALQINDAGTTLAVAELMRLLVDEYAIDWDKSWEIVTSITNYTSHSIILDGLERYPVELFKSILPRHLDIIYEINRRFLEKVSTRWANEQIWIIRLSLFDEQGGKRLRMSHLGCVASYHTSGLLDQTNQIPRDPTLRDFCEFNPKQFIPILNGVSPRRFLALANPTLAKLITDTIGSAWIHDSTQLSSLEAYTEDTTFCTEWRNIKYANKQRLSLAVKDMVGFLPNPASIFDVQIKRIREYKRQHLNILHIISRYFALKDNPNIDVVPRVWIFTGKAAPGAFLTQLILELILKVAKVINSEKAVKDKMSVIFLPNFEIKDPFRMYAATDLSEQITTAGKEPSSAGTVKFALNGALTIGSFDGANIEIQAMTGANNFFSFGMNEMQLRNLRATGYRPSDYCESNLELNNAVNAIARGYFSDGDHSHFQPLLDAILNWDSAFALADFASYAQCQTRIDTVWNDTDQWTRSSILNTARAGHFSADLAALHRNKHKWNIPSVS